MSCHFSYTIQKMHGYGTRLESFLYAVCSQKLFCTMLNYTTLSYTQPSAYLFVNCFPEKASFQQILRVAVNPNSTFQEIKVSDSQLDINYMTALPEFQQVLIYVAFYGAFLTCSVPDERDFFDKTARTFLNKQSSLKIVLNPNP